MIIKSGGVRYELKMFYDKIFLNGIECKIEKVGFRTPLICDTEFFDPFLSRVVIPDFTHMSPNLKEVVSYIANRSLHRGRCPSFDLNVYGASINIVGYSRRVVMRGQIRGEDVITDLLVSNMLPLF